MKKIRNEKGKWLNSSVFREEAIKFQKNKTYTSAPWGTPDWMEYWETHLERTKLILQLLGVLLIGWNIGKPI